MSAKILPYVDPELPEDAPAWARTWCSTKKPMDRRFHAENAQLCAVSRGAGGGPALLDLMQRFPMHALCRVRAHAPLYALRSAVRVYGGAVAQFTQSGGLEKTGETDAEELCVVMMMAVGRRGDYHIGTCEDPADCKMDGPDHPLVRPEDLTLLGFWQGVTPEVMRAIYQGQPFKVVRDMAAKRWRDLS